MGLGRRRHVPIALKEKMVVMHGAHRLSGCRIADLMGVHPSTVRRALKNAYTIGTVVKKPLCVGCRRMLNGIDCAVRGFYPTSSIYRGSDTYHPVP